MRTVVVNVRISALSSFGDLLAGDLGFGVLLVDFLDDQVRRRRLGILNRRQLDLLRNILWELVVVDDGSELEDEIAELFMAILHQLLNGFEIGHFLFDFVLLGLPELDFLVRRPNFRLQLDFLQIHGL